TTYLHYESIWRTVDYLNRMGKKTKEFTLREGTVHHGGKPINSTYIERILRSQLYIGNVPYKNAWYTGGKHPPIMDKETFQRTQEILSRNRESHTTEKRNHRFLLDGLVKCASCGYGMTQKTGTGRKKTYLYYQCISKVKFPKMNFCKVRQISAPILESIIDW